MITKPIEYVRRIMRQRSPKTMEETIHRIQEEAWREGMIDAAEDIDKGKTTSLVRERALVPWKRV